MYNSDLNLIVAIIVAFFSATATACAVNRKGRSKAWIFFTILFSPLFLIVELLPNRNKQKAPVLISCPLCHKEISSEVKKCPYCGHNMPRQHSLFAVIYERIICVVWVTVIILGAIGILIDNNNTSFQTSSEDNLKGGNSYNQDEIEPSQTSINKSIKLFDKFNCSSPLNELTTIVINCHKNFKNQTDDDACYIADSYATAFISLLEHKGRDIPVNNYFSYDNNQNRQDEYLNRRFNGKFPGISFAFGGEKEKIMEKLVKKCHLYQ